jgi:putative SbcD/Mre11-related phosphoesterase
MFTLLTPNAAALVQTSKKRTLVISDPHLGWEMALQEKGIHIPSQTSKLLAKLVTLLGQIKPDALLILGDVKFTVVVSEPGEWHDIPGFFSELKNHVSEIGVVRGNHDANLEPMLPEHIDVHPAGGIVVGDVGLFHGHKWPHPSLLGCKTLVMGHLHPVVVLRDPAGFRLNRQVWVKADIRTETLARILLQKHGVKIEGTVEETLAKHYRVKPYAKQLFLMPSFNDFLGGRPVNESRPRKEFSKEPLIGPVLKTEGVDINDSELYLLDGTYLGTINQLRRL